MEGKQFTPEEIAGILEKKMGTVAKTNPYARAILDLLHDPSKSKKTLNDDISDTVSAMTVAIGSAIAISTNRETTIEVVFSAILNLAQCFVDGIEEYAESNDAIQLPDQSSKPTLH